MESSQQAPPDYVLQSRDPAYWAEQAQFEHWRSMTIQEKGALLERWNAAVHELHLHGLRELYPHASEQELELRAAAARYGRELVRDLLGFDAGG